MANVSRMRASVENESKAGKFKEIGAEFCVFKSNAPGLKLNFYEPYVDMPRGHMDRAVLPTTA